jgi:murein DD-endopeptidase MepM/ murein hydrolase activator NlpD
VAAAAALAAVACAPRPGAVVRGPSVELVAPPPRVADPAPGPAPAAAVHVVRQGETIYRIARAYGVEPAELMQRNGLSDPRALTVGAELIVPGPRTSTRTPTTAAAAQQEAGHPERSDAAAAAERSRGAPTRTRPLVATASADPSAVHPERGAAAEAAARSRGTVLAWPLRGVLYGRYGVRAGQRHDGIDIAAPEGAPVAAAADGTVLFAGDQAGYGAVVILRHESGLVTLYAHNSRVLVHEGARVARGEAIARVGQTGRTTGPHLHFEVREGTRPRDPLLFLR